MPNKCELGDSIVVMIVIGWLVSIILMALLFSVTGLQEGLATLSFDDVKARADCCPSSFSTSNGCACLTQDQLTAIYTRGGNR
jgi:hypothetical protein